MRQKTILITGATDGIGLETAKMLVAGGHRVLVHGRSPRKLEETAEVLDALFDQGAVETYLADLADFQKVRQFAAEVARRHKELDVLINNAGVFTLGNPRTTAGLDARFAVNTVAPYLLVIELLPVLGSSGRVVNLSSAAQASVDIEALLGKQDLSDGEAYAQSKLALTMWSRALALKHEEGPAIIAVNPGSFLGSKMVKEAYGMAGKDLRIGAESLCRAALDDSFTAASGKYFDNDSGQFARPHSDVFDDAKVSALLAAIESLV